MKLKYLLAYLINSQERMRCKKIELMSAYFYRNNQKLSKSIDF